MKLSRHVYEYDKIVLGGTLESFLYSYFNGLPCIFRNLIVPFRFDNLSDGLTFGKIGIDSPNYLKAFEHLLVTLSLSGQLPTGPNVSSININDNTLKIITPHSRVAKFSFEKLIVFDDRDIAGLPDITNQVINKSRVIDWFDVKSGMQHELEELSTEEDFVNKIYFYPSDRFGSQTTDRIRKDVVSISYLDQRELQQFEFSETMARFKITDLMKAAGIRGARNGRDTYNPNLYRYYSVKLESSERSIEQSIVNTYKKDNRFEFKTLNPENILTKASDAILPYTKKINQNLLDFR